MEIVIKGKRLTFDKEGYDRLKAFSENSLQLMTGKKLVPYVTVRKGLRVYQVARVIMDVTTKKKRVIFRDGNPLNLTRKNLLVCTASQAASHRRSKVAGATSKYLGVHLVTSSGKWRAIIKPNPKSPYEHIGYFENESDAAKAFNKKAKEYFGERATLNQFGKRAAKKKTKAKA